MFGFWWLDNLFFIEGIVIYGVFFFNEFYFFIVIYGVFFFSEFYFFIRKGYK